MATTAGIIELENTLTKTRLYNEEINFNILSNICFYGKCTRSKTLSLKDAITYALENKSDAKKARLKVENSKYQIQEVRSRALPKITANGGLTYNPILQTTFLDRIFW
jgi:hypothetical protein